ncbi:hypothetical protein ACIP98_38190 [Streptomyces sp. NPDC088354]|uniref:hypothetical protein n=1 Tax=Streptomyces sp. NPDC088354 TaxID=3365856 RepID=UPI003818174E
MASGRFGDWTWVIRGIALAYCLGEGVFYLGWLTVMSWRTGQQLPDGDSMRWGFPVLLVGSALFQVPMTGYMWWLDLAAGRRFPRSVRLWLPVAFVAVLSVFVMVTATKVAFPAFLIGAVMAFLGIMALFFLPMALSPRLPAVLRERRRLTRHCSRSVRCQSRDVIAERGVPDRCPGETAR